ncbi:MAG: MarR family winged helix-turn-helix transcriptional regulator [Acidimicrobiales bacterium]
MEANELGYVIKRTQQALRNAIDPALADLGLTMAQYAAMYTLHRHPGTSNAELARLSFVTPQTMVRIVADLERRGLLYRTPSPAHGRVLEADLSDRGNNLLKRAQRRVDLVHARMLEDVPAIETERLYRWLTQIATRLEAE